MRRFTRLTGALLALLLVFSVLSGCGGAAPDVPSSRIDSISAWDNACLLLRIFGNMGTPPCCIYAGKPAGVGWI